MNRFYLRFMKKSWQKVLWAACIITVFVVTYLLILPATTIEKNVAENTPGIESIEKEGVSNNVRNVLTCTLSEHLHDESCYTDELVLDGYEVLFCKTEEHTHSDICRDDNGDLICGKEEHAHDDNCYLMVGFTEDDCVVYACRQVSHKHSNVCYNENQELICSLKEHEHTKTCIDLEYETKGSDVYICGLKNHEHDDSCLNEDGEVICGMQEHVHTASCTETVQPEYENVLSCGIEEHVHSAKCYTVYVVEDPSNEGEDVYVASKEGTLPEACLIFDYSSSLL